MSVESLAFVRWFTPAHDSTSCDLEDITFRILPLIVSVLIVFIGYWLTGRARRREWIADNKKEEFRRVLTALNRMNMMLVKQQLGTPSTDAELQDALNESTEAVNTSIFIADFLEKSRVLNEVKEAVRMLGQTHDWDGYAKAYWDAVNKILREAKRTKI